MGTTSSTFVATNQSTTDPNVGDKVTNTYLWSINGQQIANLILPFNTQNEITAKDYSAYSNDGTVIGATWTANGKVGGAYSFDGQNDAIIISDGGAGYYDNKTHSNYNPELGGDGTWTAMSVEAWINLSAYNNGSRIIAKYPSYEIGFESNFNAGQSTRLVASVWPHTGAISTDDNHASTDRAQTITANVNLQLNTWYHIAFTYESGVGIKLYLNGIQVAQRTGVTGVLENSLGAPVTIGRLVQPFAGIIDEVQIYPYALSATNINNYYLATKDGSSTSSTFNPSGMVAPGNTLTCTIIPSDSYVDGTSRSTTIALLNTPPTASGLQISPIRADNTRLSTETLSAYYTYFDVEGQPESGSQIRWYMNGGLQSGLNDQKNVPSATTQIGQTWYFTVTPRDTGGALGTTQTSPTVTIRGNNAPTTTTPTLDSTNGGTAYSDEDLTTTAGTTTDTDNDATTNIFHWTQNGISQTNLQMPFDTEVPTVPNTNGFVKDYSGYNNNGAANGSTWVEDGIIGGALSFNGDDFITVQENGNSLGGDGSWSQISVEFWAQASGATSTQTVVLKPDSTYGPGINSFGVGYRAQYRSYTNGYRIYWIIGSGTTLTSLNVQINQGPGEWHHVVCTYQSGVGLKIYTDGVLRASLAATGNINATPGGQLYIGGVNSGSGDFVGQMDEVRIYPTALSAAQIFQRYADTSDGISDSETVVPQQTTTGDTWRCQVTPNDALVDGNTINSQTLTITSRNTQPHIDWYSPTNKTLSTDIGSSINFAQISSGSAPTYAWTLDSIQQATTQNWTYTPDHASTHTIRVTATSGGLSDYQEWTVNVNGGDPTPQYTLTILPSSNGNTNPTQGGYQYSENSQASIQATPNTGYVFTNWLRNGTNVGNTNPYLLTMNANYELAAVFTPVPQYTLTILPSSNGNTNLTVGAHQYIEGNQVSIQATPNAGYTFSNWILNGTNVGSTNPYALTMTSNWELTAVFTQIPAPVNYLLTVSTIGSGTTNATVPTLYLEGSNVRVLATADPNWKLDHWTLNGTNVGSTNPYLLTMSANYELTAIFTLQTYTLTINVVGDGSVTKNPDQTTYQYGTMVTLTVTAGPDYTFGGWTGDATGTNQMTSITMTSNKVVTATFNSQNPVNPPLFEDGFESGDFSQWSSTTRTTSETTSVTTNIIHQGTYSGMFTSSGDGSYERAYASKSGLSLSELYIRAYVYVDQSGIADNSDRFYFIQLMSGANILAYGGWRQDTSGNLRWHLMIRDGTTTVGAYSTTIPATDTWYCVELHWKSDSTNGLGELYVDGTLVASIVNRNTANYGNTALARVGLPEIYNSAQTTTYIDDVAISTTYIGPTGTPQQVALTINSATGGSTNPTNDVYQVNKGTIQYVTALPNSGYTLSGWLLDGNPVANTNPYPITMNNDHTITPVFTLIPPPVNYLLTVSTTGSGTTNATVPTLYLEGSNVRVLATADSNWKFDHWMLNGTNVGSTNPYALTMTSNWELTAVFTLIPAPVNYLLTVSTTGSGTTNATVPTLYLEGSNVRVLATADSNWKFDHWTLNGTNVGSTNPYTATMTSNWILIAVFIENQGNDNTILSDNFESGTLNAWTPSTTSGETTTITTNPTYAGTYAVSFATNGNGGYEKAYLADTLNPTMGTVAIQGVFTFSQNGILDNGDKIKLIEIRSGSTIIAAAGVIQRSGTLSWWLETRDGTSYIETYSTQGMVDLSTWFTLEIQWINDASNGGATLWINGNQIIQVSGDNTSNYGNANQVRIGLAEVYNCASTTIALDNAIIASDKIGP